MKKANGSAPKPEVLKPDICVIGASSAGLSVASVAVSLGASVVLIERHRPGCEPLRVSTMASKALIAAARHAHGLCQAKRFGVGTDDAPPIDFPKVKARIKEVVTSGAPMDSFERYRAMGVRVILDEARFIDARTVEAGNATVKARRFVIATGSRAAIPEIPGLDEVPYLTDETFLNLTELPGHLLVVGDHAAGIEMAQSFRRLGSKVTVIDARVRILTQEDPEMASVVERALRMEGIDFRYGQKVARADKSERGGVALVFQDESILEGSHLLVAAGRMPVMEGLDLEKAGIEADPSGITVDQGLKTTNSRVYAIGDCARKAGGHFPHVANHHASLVIRNALFQLPIRFGGTPIPRLVHSDPELATVGMTEEEARARYSVIRILRWPFFDNDRAQAEGETIGHVKAIAAANGKVLGCTIVGAHAGELIAPWTLALAKEMKISDLAGLVYPYPTLSEATKSAAVEFLKPTAQNPWVRRLVGFVGRLG